MIYRVIRGILWVWIRVWYNFKIENFPNSIPQGRLIIASNHTSMMDIVALIVAFPRHIRFIAKKELSNNFFFNLLCKKMGVIFIDRESNDIESIRKTLQVLKQEEVIGIFPEGTRKHSIDEKNIKNGVALLSMRGKAPILPIAIKSSFRFRKPLIISYKAIITPNEREGKSNNDLRQEISKEIFDSLYS